MRFNRILTGLFVMLLSAGANATLVAGSSLQDGLDAITVGTDFLDVNADQLGYDEIWQIDSSGASINTLVFEFALFAPTTTFGIYDVNAPGTKLEIFSGIDGSGQIDASFNFGSVTFTNLALGPNTAPPTSVTFTTTRFGYYLDVDATGKTYYSEAALNTDGPGGTEADHMVTYAGGTGLMIDVFGEDDGGSSFAAGEFILAWEDLDFGVSDFDYSDMVVLVESVTVPEPATLGLLGLGLLGLGIARRRKV